MGNFEREREHERDREADTEGNQGQKKKGAKSQVKRINWRIKVWDSFFKVGGESI